MKLSPNSWTGIWHLMSSPCRHQLAISAMQLKQRASNPTDKTGYLSQIIINESSWHRAGASQYYFQIISSLKGLTNKMGLILNTAKILVYVVLNSSRFSLKKMTEMSFGIMQTNYALSCQSLFSVTTLRIRWLLGSINLKACLVDPRWTSNK